MRARELMTIEVSSVRPDAPIERAVDIMLKRRLGCLPVVDDTGRLVGMVTEGDLLRSVEIETQKHRPRWIQFFLSPGRRAEDHAYARGRKVSEAMTESVIYANEETILETIVDLMMRDASQCSLTAVARMMK